MCCVHTLQYARLQTKLPETTLGRPEEGARLVALCLAIKSDIAHSDAQRELEMMLSLLVPKVPETDTNTAPAMPESSGRVQELLERATAAYADDQGWGWVRATFSVL